MEWKGKAVGGILGFAAAGPVGSVLGLLLGHKFDQGSRGRLGAESFATAPEAVRPFFLEAAFEIMGCIAKSDGRVSEEEIRAARRIMHAMQLAPEQVTTAIERFTAGKSADFPLAERLEELARRLGRNDVRRSFVEIQMQAAVGAGALGQTKRALLWRVASALDLGRVEFAQIEALVRAQHYRGAGPGAGEAIQVDAAYRVLGVSSEATDEDVKTAYRRLMNQHHPDKLVARGQPQAKVAAAEQRTHEIRAAYDRIKAYRAFK